MDFPEIESAEKIIRNHVWFSVLPGLAPLPVLDIIGITSVQVDMVKQLCRLYGKDFDEQRGKSITTAVFSTLLGRLPAFALRSGLKAIPGIGWVLGGLTMSAFAGASTYATGMVFKEHFEQGGTLNDLNPESFRRFYRKQFEDGRKVLRRMWLGDEQKTES